jgi:hypothetical protein
VKLHHRLRRLVAVIVEAADSVSRAASAHALLKSGVKLCEIAELEERLQVFEERAQRDR